MPTPLDAHINTMRALLVVLAIAAPAAAAERPLKVFILAGQSNMEGHAKIETFDYLGDDRATAPLLAMMRDADGRPAICDHVWISYLTGGRNGSGESFGRLTAGYGARPTPSRDGGKIGPEFTFGLTMDRALAEPVLLIKTAWGGKSLFHDFRPPSAGVAPRSATDIENNRYAEEDSGRFYRLMIDHVKSTLADITRVCPAHDPARGHEIAGFVWLQGWNDMVDRNAYPPTRSDGQPRYAEYSRLLAHLIRDVRTDLGSPRMPFVIGVMGVGGAKPGASVEAFREAMAAPASLPEFRDTVTAVPTAPFWPEELGAIADKKEQVRRMRHLLDTKHKDHANADGSMTEERKRQFLADYESQLITPDEAARWTRGASNAGYHYLGCAKTFALMGRAFAEANLAMLEAEPARQSDHTPPRQRDAANTDEDGSREVEPGELAGYLFGPVEKVPEEYNGGFSLYAAAWPLVRTYPGHSFQTGLCGTWMHPQHEPGRTPEGKCYTDIEGGLGWWRDTRFPTETPKFIMGGVGPNFSTIANGPGYGAGTWDAPRGQYGVAQLSPWILFPLDGLNLKQGTCGELFGYGYLPLPLTNPKATTAGRDLPTGNHCWTLFLNTRTFKGPVAFFTPFFWSQATVEHPEWAGMLLDSRPAGPNKAFQMETQHIPAVLSSTATGKTCARIAPTSFPANADGCSVVLHRVTSYTKSALWSDVEAWFAGGVAATGRIDPADSVVHTFRPSGGSNWSIHPPRTPRDRRVPVAWGSFAMPFTPNPITFGYRWDERLTTRNGALITLPEYYELSAAGDRPRWTVLSASDVPPHAGLARHRFERATEPPQPPRTTPDEAASCWRTPGPAAGPFKARLGDGSVVTYSWYRFADQPAMLNADLTPEEREQVQTRVERLHRHWTKDRDYLVPPDVGTLAEIDPALILTPPVGLEIGYVPIATRQEIDAAAPPAAPGDDTRPR